MIDFKIIFKVVIISIVTSQIFAISEDSDYWQRIRSYDYDGFLTEYNDLDENNIINRGKLAYALYVTGEKDKQWVEIAATNLTTVLEDSTISPNDRAEISYILAESCIGLIVDAPTYMKYSDTYESSIIKCLELDPSNPYFKLNSAQGMMWFPTSRGTEDDGKELLFSLEKEYPTNQNVLMAISNFRLNEGEVAKAESGYRSILNINKNHKDARNRVDEIELSKKELEIRDIIIVNELKTSKSRVLKKLASFKGQSFGVNTKREINNEVSEISSIGSTDVKGIQIDERYIDLELKVEENNMKALMFLLGFGIGFDYDSEVQPGGLGAVAYMDANFLGTGANLMFLTAGIFNKADLTFPGLIDDGIIDMKLSLESLVYNPIKSGVYQDGIKAYSQKDTYHSAQVGFGRDLPIGLSAFVHYNSNWTFKPDIKDHESPNMIHTNTVSTEIAFDTVGMVLSPLENQNGFKVYFNGQWIYKDNYEAWGKEGNLFEHNDKAALSFRTHLGYYTDTVKNQNIRLDVKWLATHNPYESSKFFIGQAETTMDSDSLIGYLPGEIVLKNAFTGNLNYTFNVIPKKFNLVAKYDVAFDINKGDFYNGAGLGLAVKLPFDIDLSTQFGIGFNANRDDGLGYQASLTLSKLSVL